METNNGKAERLVFTITETANLLGISRGTAYFLANTGGIPAIRIGQRRLVVPRKALEDFLSTVSKPKKS